MSNEFEDVTKGDRVWDFAYGWGFVKNAWTDGTFRVDFERGAAADYNIRGVEQYMGKADQNRTLFWDEISVEAPPRPVPTRVFNGIEILDTAIDEITWGCSVFVPNIFSNNYCQLIKVVDTDNHTIACNAQKLGAAYPNTKDGRIAAIRHAFAMIGEDFVALNSSED